MSLEVFVFVASIVEEVIAPIPSPTVMVLSGSLASMQGREIYALIPLICIGAFAKTIGALIVYAIAHFAEDFVMRKFGKFFKVSQDDVQNFSKKLGNGKRDYVLLTVLRALPFIPSVLLSVGGGILKISIPLFIVSTFLGTLVRDGFYLYAGFVGTEYLHTFVKNSSHIEVYVEIIFGIVIIGIVGRFLYRRRKNNTSL